MRHTPLETTLQTVIIQLLDETPEVVLQGYTSLNETLTSLCAGREVNTTNFRKDAAFAEFITLQDSMRFNMASVIATNLTKGLLPLTAKLLAFRALQGVLLLHPASRDVFNNPSNMKIMVDCLRVRDPVCPQPLLLECLVTLMHILVRNRNNFRNFERLQGPRILVELLFRQGEDTAPGKEEQINLKFKIIEFLIFYLVDEKPVEAPTETVGENPARRRPEPRTGNTAERKSRAQKTTELEAINPAIKEFIGKIEELDAFSEVRW